VLLFAGLAACHRQAEAPATVSGRPEAAVAQAEASTDASTPTGVAAAVAPAEAAKNDETELHAEEREADPSSESVTLRLNVSPPVRAPVMWGGKKLGQLTPGNPWLELERPRGSGPLDVEIRAEGFLPHHTRLHTDRSDKVNVRLIRPAEAPGVHGYRAAMAAQAAKQK
jgi:hypothetical protein